MQLHVFAFILYARIYKYANMARPLEPPKSFRKNQTSPLILRNVWSTLVSPYTVCLGDVSRHINLIFENKVIVCCLCVDLRSFPPLKWVMPLRCEMRTAGTERKIQANGDDTDTKWWQTLNSFCLSLCVLGIFSFDNWDNQIMMTHLNLSSENNVYLIQSLDTTHLNLFSVAVLRSLTLYFLKLEQLGINSAFKCPQTYIMGKRTEYDILWSSSPRICLSFLIFLSDNVTSRAICCLLVHEGRQNPSAPEKKASSTPHLGSNQRKHSVARGYIDPFTLTTNSGCHGFFLSLTRTTSHLTLPSWSDQRMWSRLHESNNAHAHTHFHFSVMWCTEHYGGCIWESTYLTCPCHRISTMQPYVYRHKCVILIYIN